MRLLACWLLVVAAFRLSSTYFGYFDKCGLQVAVFSETEVTEVHARTFGAWTAVSSLLCSLCAFHLSDAPLYAATALSFFASLLFCAAEYALFKTMDLRNFAMDGAIACVSLVWMLLEMNDIAEERSQGKTD